MSTPTFFMGLPNPTPFSDAGTWANSIVTCITGFDTLAVAQVPATVTSSGTLAVYNGVALIEANATSGAIVLTLPDATLAANKGRRYVIVKTDSSVNTVTISGAQTISGAASVVLSTQWAITAITADGTQWINADPEGTVSNPVTVAQGGTGVATLALNGVLYGNGTSPVQVTTAGGANSVLTANAGAPSFSSTPTVTSVTTTGGAVIGTKITSYNAQVTAGNGISSIVAATSQKSESAADANVLTFTPPAVAGSYRVRFVLSVSAAVAATLGWTATWKDSNGNAQTPTNLALSQSGVAAPALTFTTSVAANYYGYIDIDVDNSATNVVVQLTFTGTSFTAKASATIERVV
jgi:hypothetical protein